VSDTIIAAVVGAVIGFACGWLRKAPVAKVRIEVPRNGTFVVRPDGNTYLTWEWEPTRAAAPTDRIEGGERSA
jgi:hypothetical protein